MGTTTMLVIGIALLLAVAIGGGAAWLLTERRRDTTQAADLVAELRRIVADQQEELQRLREDSLTGAIEQLAAVNRAQFSAQHEHGSAALEARKELIDGQLGDMREELGRMTDLVQALERDREHKFGEIGQLLEVQRKRLGELADSTESLRRTLSGPKSRGQWGERMADDVLRHAGFLDGVNYVKQRQIASGEVPDFTFLLPNDLYLHMDVKFPFDNLRRAVETESELEARKYRDAFRSDVRERVKELARRGYVDATETVDCVLLFIPSDELYAYVQQIDGDLVDQALAQRIVLCSPLTLFPVLAIVRQAVDTFRLSRTSDEILRRLAAFSDQWQRFVDHMEKVGRSVDRVGKDFEALLGTRRRLLDRELDRIEILRRERIERGTDDAPTATVGGSEDPPLALEA